jgi:hypothetical protein
MALNTNPAVQAEGVTRWLEKLTLALADYHVGAKPDLLRSQSRPGRPPRPSIDILKASVAHVLEVMTSGGRTQDDAARFIASLLRKRGIKKVAGINVDSKLIVSWGRGMKEHVASDAAVRVYGLLAQERDKHVGAGQIADPAKEARLLLEHILRLWN